MLHRVLTFTFSTLLLTSCSWPTATPVPSEKLDYVGEWRSPEMTLLIRKEGLVTYRKLEGLPISVDGPLHKFKDDDFVVGYNFAFTTFNVTEPPNQVDGVWQMIVDGVRLTKYDDKQ